MRTASVGVVGFALCMLLALVVSGCSDEASTETSAPGPDTACTHFRTVVTDTAAGRLTENEVRVEFEGILDAAQEAGTAAMVDAAQRVTVALSVGDMVGFEDAFRDMDAACSDAGF